MPAKPIPRDLLLELLAIVVAIAFVAVVTTVGVVILAAWVAGKGLEAQLITQLNSNPNTAKMLGRVKRLIWLI
jgi:hypothetical protein